LKIATKKIAMRGIMGIPSDHYPDPHGGSSAKIGEFASMSPPVAILTGLIVTLLKLLLTKIHSIFTGIAVVV